MKITTIETAYPLSSMQQGMLYHSLQAQQSGVDIEQVICSIRDRLNINAFIQAWQSVVERHPVLRTSFDWKSDRKPLQCVHLQPVIELEQEDWRGLSKLEQEQQLQIYLQRDRALGFQMDRLPLMRLALFQISDSDYQFIWTFHHAILDGRSLSIVLKEVFAFYDAFCQKEDLQLPQARPYQDYIQWLQQDWSKAASFWQQLLKGFTAPTPLLVKSTLVNLNLNAELKGVDSSFGDREIRLSEQTTAMLQSLAQQYQLTLNTLVQGAWAILLSRYSRETDVVFGATRACRHSSVAGAESMVGLLINTLPVRVDVSPEQQLLPWLKELRSQWVALRDYEHTPLVNIQSWSEVPSGTPLFHSLIVFENYELNTALRSQGGKWENLEFRLEEQTNYPLTLVGCAGAELLLKLKYDRQRFDDATSERMLGHLQTLLLNMATNPWQSLGELPLLTTAERDRILQEWNDTDRDFPQHLCIHQLFEARVELTPEAVAVVFEDRQLTYSELNCRANQLARHLQQLGVKPGVLVAVYLERSLETVVAVMGILKAGGAYVPLEPSFPKARIQLLLSSLGIDCLVTQTSLLAGLEEIQAELPALQHYICLNAEETIPPSPPCEGGSRTFSPPCEGGLGGSEQPLRDRQIWRHSHLDRLPTENLSLSASSDDVAYVIFTSGSTGTPKGVVVRHQPVINLIQWVNETFTVNSSDRVLFVTSLCFDLSVYDIFGLLAAGGSIRVVSNRDVQDPEALLRILCDEPITVWDSAPPALQQLATFFPTIKSGDRHPQLRLVFMSGDWIPVKLPDAVKATFPGVEVISLGGATEATVWSNYYPIETVEPHWVSIPYGKPIQNARYYILDSYLNPCPVGVAGELHIGGKCLASGYLNQSELTAQKFIPDPFNDNPIARLYKTGDLARYLPDGNIEFLGRIDHQVKMRGFRIELGEIEAVLAKHPQVKETVILVREDEPGNKRLVAYVVGHQPAPTPNELRRFLQEKLPEYMIPAVFVAIAEIPLTPNGKVDRRALPIPDRDRPDLEKAFAAPSNAVELQLTQIWSEILGIQSIGVGDNFFELGGHSLLAVQLFTQIESKFGKKLPLATLFQAPTIEQLASILGRSEQLVSWSSLVAIQPHGNKRPLFCIHALGGNVLGYQKLIRHLGSEQPVYGLQARGLDGKQNPHTRVEDMAADYIQEMQTVQPNGPYLLCGFSSGGTVAFEMARQLQAGGETVALLAMFDTYSPHLFIRNPSLFRTVYTYLRTLWRLPLSEKQSYFLQKLDWMHSLLTGKPSSKYDLWNNYSLSNDTNPFNMVLIEALKQATMADYVPQTYSGRVTLFTSKEVLRWCYSTPDRGWNSIVERGVEIHEIPGTHLGLLDEPNVQVLASKLKVCLEEAQISDRVLSLVNNSCAIELSIG